MQRFTLHSTQGKHEIIAPSNWRELTLQQLIEIETDWRESPSVLKAFSILTGLSLEITENLNDPDIETKVWQIMSFIADAPKWEELTPPKTLFFDSQAYKLPNKVGAFMLGQKIMLSQAVESIDNMVKNIPLCVAIIMQPHIDKRRNKGQLKYNSERVEELSQRFLKENGLDYYSTAVFFFKQIKNYVEYYDKRFREVPKGQRPNEDIIKKLAKAERLTPFSDLALIDGVVQNSQGAYTHDQVFEMDLDFVYNLTLMHHEQAEFQKRYSLYEAEMNKPKK